MTIKIVDAPMGAGKTSAAINFINEHKAENKFIYITPYLEEVARIKKACGFSEPFNFTKNSPKRLSLIQFLNKGENIVTTHSMFHLFDDEIIDLCRAQDYILIMDEVTDVVEPYQMKAKDLEILLRDFVTADANGVLHWTAQEQTDKFDDERRLCDLGCLAMYSNVAMVWLFPVKIFEAFETSYLLTYMFDAQVQKYYYDYYGLSYEPLYVIGDSIAEFRFTDEPQQYRVKCSAINIIDDEKLNAIGNSPTALSKSWYWRNRENVLIKTLKKNTFNFFNNRLVLFRNGEYVKSSASNNLWTTFSDYKALLSGKGYSKGFIPSNMRATNAYRDRSVIAYLVNKYFNPVVKNFFTSQGIEVDEDAFATSEMLQFIWRSAARDGKPITIYIPSSRMRQLLIDFLRKNDIISDVN